MSCTNIRALNGNLDTVHHHLKCSNPVIFILTETQIGLRVSTNHVLYSRLRSTRIILELMKEEEDRMNFLCH